MKQTLIFFVSLWAILASAQTQQGVVKTRGRMVEGKLQPGKGLSNATVEMENRSVLSQKDGIFSFPLQTKTYLIKNVKKQGYILVDLESLRERQYSADPVYLVMETPEQQQADLVMAERKIRRNLQRQLQLREDEIENLKSTSQHEKDSLLNLLYQKQSDNEKLISDMAKRYSSLDYDQLDEFYRTVSYYIENGELTRADSLLRTRGDLSSQVKDIIQQGQVIHNQKELVQKAEKVHQTDVEEAALRCYSYYETFLAQHQNDSAAYYLELRSELDSTNLDYLSDLGDFICNYMADYNKAHTIFERCLRYAILQEGESGEWVGASYNYLGTVNIMGGDYPKGLEYFQKAKDIQEKVLGSDHIDVAMTYGNIGSAYAFLGMYVEALEYHQKGLVIKEKTLGSEHPEVASTYCNIGSDYVRKGMYAKALEYYEKALVIQKDAYGLEDINVALNYCNIGGVYCILKLLRVIIIWDRFIAIWVSMPKL